MRFVPLWAALFLLASAWTGPSYAAGCVKGAVVGGVAGHVAGHHGAAGAAAGCAIGHHEAKKHAGQNAAQQPNPGGEGQAKANNGH